LISFLKLLPRKINLIVYFVYSEDLRYHFIFSDKRVKDWFLMSSPLPTLTMCLSYAFIVKVLGPRLMRDRKPFQLRKTLIVYNLLQVIFSTWIFYEAWDGAWGNGYSLRCEPVDYSTTPSAMRVSASITK